MRSGMKMLMIANRNGSGGRNEGGSGGQNEIRRSGSGGRNEMEMGYGSEMAYGRSDRGSGGRNEMRGGYGETRGNYSGTNNRSNYARNEYENEMRDMDARFRGRERSNYYPYGEQMMEEAENRRRFPRRRDGTFAPRSEMEEMEEMENRRRRDSRGRFTSEMEEPGMHYPYNPYVPPIYERQGGGRMNMIGFERRDEISNDYGMRAEHQRMDEMQHRGGQMEMGHGHNETKLTREMADEWVRSMENEDGSKGPHWSFEQVSQLLNQKGMEADPVEFYAVMNALYSDFEPVFKKFGVSNLEFYREMAKCWIKDKDAVPNKAAAYYKYIAK